MSRSRSFAISAVLIGLLALIHAAFTWPSIAVVAFFAGGAVVAFIAEAAVINRGWLEHHIGPMVFGVPLYALLGWVGTIYVAFRLALLVTTGGIAVILAGVLATAYDLFTDPRGVKEGYWTYSPDAPGLRYRSVPRWIFLGWFLISCLTASLAMPFL